MLILTVDHFLGRVDYSSMSDQMLMETLIGGFDDGTKRKYQDKSGMYLDVCKWSGIKCDADQRVTNISVNSEHSSGSLELCYVPSKVKELWINPPGKSELTGSVDLTRLPDGMESLCLTSNQLTGEIDLTRLPEGMVSLALNDNQLTGEVDLTRLPEDMLFLHLSENQLSGSLVIRNLPPWIKILDLQVNLFNAIAVVDSKSNAVIKLKESGVTSVVDESGEELHSEWFFA